MAATHVLALGVFLVFVLVRRNILVCDLASTQLGIVICSGVYRWYLVSLNLFNEEEDK